MIWKYLCKLWKSLRIDLPAVFDAGLYLWSLWEEQRRVQALVYNLSSYFLSFRLSICKEMTPWSTYLDRLWRRSIEDHLWSESYRGQWSQQLLWKSTKWYLCARKPLANLDRFKPLDVLCFQRQFRQLWLSKSNFSSPAWWCSCLLTMLDYHDRETSYFSISEH